MDAVLPAARAPAATPASACLHCDLPLGQLALGDFCCRGCQTVYALLRGEDLERYYQLRQGPGAPVVDLPKADRDLDWLDESLLESANPQQRHLRMDVQGIHCAGCVWILEKTFAQHKDALKLIVNPALGNAELWVGHDFPLRDWIHATERFGYRFGPSLKSHNKSSDGLLLRLGICIAIAVNVMLLSAALYLGLEEGRLYHAFRKMSYGLTSVSVLVGAPVFLRSALAGLRGRVLHLDVPISTGIVLAFAGSSWAFWTGSDSALYLDSVSIFIALMLLGRYLQERVLTANRQRLLESQGSEGLRSKRMREGTPQTIKSTDIVEGDTLLIAPGDLVPVDSQLISPRAQVSTDWINGEGIPLTRESGQGLTAGSFNAGSAAFQVRAAADFHASPLDALLRPSGAASIAAHESGLVRIISSYYVAFVLLAATMGFAGWLLVAQDSSRALEVAIAVLVVTCPCAFGIATPLAHELVQARLRREGLYVRSGDFLARANEITKVVFDKTGTVTTGNMALANPPLLDTLTEVERQILYDLSARSTHPTSVAIASALQPYQLSLQGDLESEERVGEGIRCRDGAKEYRLGKSSWAAPEATPPAGTVFSVDGEIRARFDAVEEPRLDALHELRALEDEGYQVFLLSGDSDERVKKMAQELGLPASRALSGCSPEEKRQWLEKNDRGDMLFLGDGINDSLAAQQASCSGTPALDRPFMAAHCDFYLGTDHLAPVRSALHAAKELATVIRRNLIFALAYNLLAICLAWSGLMRPWLAAILMPASSIAIVVATTLTLSPRKKSWK